MEVPFLPVDITAVQLEGHAFRLGNVDRLEVISEADLSLNGLVIVVSRRRLVKRSTLLRNIDMHDLLGLHVEDGAKVERISVLQVVNAGPVVHQSLLKSGAIGVTLVVAFWIVSVAFTIQCDRYAYQWSRDRSRLCACLQQGFQGCHTAQ